MVRLTFSVLLVAVVIQVAAGWNFNRLWTNVKIYDKDFNLGSCAWSWFKTLYGKGYDCNSDSSSSDESYPSIKILPRYLRTPFKDPTFKTVLPNIQCVLPKGYKVPKNAVSCGNGWYKYGQSYNSCSCRGKVYCTTATTPAPTTTKATTPTTTKAQATPAPAPTTTKAPAPTTPPLVIAPTISSSDVASGSILTLTARATSTITFTVTAAPAPTVTLNGVDTSASYTLSGSPGSLPNTYEYSYTFAVADASYIGQWNVTASNGVDTLATYPFSVDVSYVDILISSATSGSPVAYDLPASGLVAFQTRFCSKMLISLVPASSAFQENSYTNGEYVQLFFDNSPVDVVASYTDQSSSVVLPICPAPGTFSTQPFWILMQLTPVADQFNVDLWTSDQFVYTSPSNATTKVTFQTQSLGYQIGSVTFDLSPDAPDIVYPSYFYYPGAV